jgi:hypothetical protein
MKRIFSRKPHLVTPVMEERIIKVAYNEGSFWDRFVVHFTRRYNPKVQTLYQCHLATVFQTESRFAEVVCPDRLEMNLFEICENGERTFKLRMIWESLTHNLQATGAIAAMLILSVVLWSNMDTYRKQQELEQATLQARESIALISSIMNGTTKTAYNHAIIEQTSRPLRESIYKGTESIKKNL